jgi:hypothetical protein
MSADRSKLYWALLTHAEKVSAIRRMASSRMSVETISGATQGESSMESVSEIRATQAKADAVYKMFGEAAPGNLQGERLMDYRIRLLSRFQKHSKVYKDSNLCRIGDAAAMTAVENQIYTDAAGALRDPATFKPGEMRPVVRRDQTGREITSYIGQDGACWDRFNPPIRHVRRFVTGR